MLEAGRLVARGRAARLARSARGAAAPTWAASRDDDLPAAHRRRPLDRIGVRRSSGWRSSSSTGRPGSSTSLRASSRSLGGLFTFQFTSDCRSARDGRARSLVAAVAGRASRPCSPSASAAHDEPRQPRSSPLGASFLAEALLLLAFGDIPRSYPGISDHAWDIRACSCSRSTS